jgi:hypothetical protein
MASVRKSSPNPLKELLKRKEAQLPPRLLTFLSVQAQLALARTR